MRLLWDQSVCRTLTAAETAASHLTAPLHLKDRDSLKCVSVCVCCILSPSWSTYKSDKSCSFHVDGGSLNMGYLSTDLFVFTCFMFWKIERNMEPIDRPIISYKSNGYNRLLQDVANAHRKHAEQPNTVQTTERILKSSGDPRVLQGRKSVRMNFRARTLNIWCQEV